MFLTALAHDHVQQAIGGRGGDCRLGGHGSVRLLPVRLAHRCGSQLVPEALALVQLLPGEEALHPPPAVHGARVGDGAS